jgi:DNA-directed RNA polymerase specialized sigma24 family protein
MLGSLSDADDAVQEAWLRLERNGPDGIRNLGGWLTTVVARVCMDMLRSRRTDGSAYEIVCSMSMTRDMLSRLDATEAQSVRCRLRRLLARHETRHASPSTRVSGSSQRNGSPEEAT